MQMLNFILLKKIPFIGASYSRQVRMPPYGGAYIHFEEVASKDTTSSIRLL